ncbi:hypothetical protein LCGC14_2360740 [marine sediment metagenome]|uniref:Uncharacterized protein n=1 Tax=marine sediment metagenome TaxID=412755 RepID=A0A0F9F1J9_9ZZZZ
MELNDPIWSYGRSILVNSTKAGIVPRWSYGKSTLRQSYIREYFVSTIADDVGITDSISATVSFVRKVVDTINISDIVVIIRRIIDSLGAPIIRRIRRINTPKIEGR